MPFFKRLLLPLLIMLPAIPSYAASTAELDRLFNAIGTPDLLVIMRREGLEQAEELRAEMFPERGGNTWPSVAGNVYDTEAMGQTFRDRFDTELKDTDIGPLLDFFQSDVGRRIVELELSGRRALLDPDVEEAAEIAYDDMVRYNPDRVAQLESFVTSNDLIDMNVMGAMNASLAFYQGLADGGGFEMGEDQILADVWSQEPMIRQDTATWMYAYLGMAYEPLGDDDLDFYSSLSQTDAGQALNRALFAGFDEVFREVSYAMGLAASRFMVGEDI